MSLRAAAASSVLIDVLHSCRACWKAAAFPSFTPDNGGSARVACSIVAESRFAVESTAVASDRLIKPPEKRLPASASAALVWSIRSICSAHAPMTAIAVAVADLLTGEGVDSTTVVVGIGVIVGQAVGVAVSVGGIGTDIGLGSFVATAATGTGGRVGVGVGATPR